MALEYNINYISSRSYTDAYNAYLTPPPGSTRVYDPNKLPRNIPYMFEYITDWIWNSLANAQARKLLLDTGFWAIRIGYCINLTPEAYDLNFPCGDLSHTLGQYAQAHPEIPVVMSSGVGYELFRQDYLYAFRNNSPYKDLGFPDSYPVRDHPCPTFAGAHFGSYQCPQSYSNDSKYRYNNNGTPLTYVPFITGVGRSPERMIPMFPEVVDIYYEIQAWSWDYTDAQFQSDYGRSIANSYTSSIRHDLAEIMSYNGGGIVPSGIAYEVEEFYIPDYYSVYTLYRDDVATGKVMAPYGVMVDNGGNSYQVGNILTLVGGDGTATVTVAHVTGGVVDSISVLNSGNNYATGITTTTGGSGTGCTINIICVYGDSGNTYKDINDNDTRFNKKSIDSAPHRILRQNYMNACVQIMTATYDKAAALNVNLLGINSWIYDMWGPAEVPWSNNTPLLQAWGRNKSVMSMYVVYYGSTRTTLTGFGQKFAAATIAGRHVYDAFFDSSTANWDSHTATISEAMVLGKFAMTMGSFRLLPINNQGGQPVRDFWIITCIHDDMQQYHEFIKYGENFVVPPAISKTNATATVFYGKDINGNAIPDNVFICCRLYNNQALFFGGVVNVYDSSDTWVSNDTSEYNFTVLSPFGSPATISCSPFGRNTIVQ